ncbi:MAG TPA: hypothetical protein VF469_16585 [Kofleriaceae bacterium]
MTSQDSSTAGGCASASPALRAVLHDEPIASFVLPGGSGRQALTRLAVKPDALRAIGVDASCPNRVRFAAFEGWIALAGEAVLGSVDDATAAAMAAVQAEAIRTTDDAGLWGLPPDVVSSDVSRHLIILGRRALPQLRPVLDDTREAPYTGGEISAIASLRHYRINDLAAGLIAVIVGVPYQNAKTPAERDAQIADLRSKI